MKILNTFFVLLFIQEKASGKFVNPCSKTTEVTPLKDIDYEKLKGKEWYDIKYGDTLPPDILKDLTLGETLKCHSFNLSSTSSPDVIGITYRYFNITDNRYETNNDYTLHSEKEYPAVIHYGFDGTIENDETSIMIGTDYETWTLTYSCYKHEGKIEESAMISSNQRTMANDILDKLSIELEKLGFTKETITLANQKGC